MTGGKERVAADAVLPAGSLDAVRLPFGKPAINALSFDLCERGGLRCRQPFAAERTDRAVRSRRTDVPHDPLALESQNLNSSFHRHAL